MIATCSDQNTAKDAMYVQNPSSKYKPALQLAVATAVRAKGRREHE